MYWGKHTAPKLLCVLLKCWTCLATFKQHPGGVVLEVCVDDPEKDDNMPAA